MADKIRKTMVTFEVPAHTSPAPGDLPPGKYRGTKVERGVHMLGGLSWTAPTYKLEVPQQTLAKIAGMEDLLGLEMDVTAEVRAGEILVVGD
ncbi:hypothetical protein [Devosia sp. SD17-2]|uniref:hypothetical protein n=1 Tax=Devosia sp. SD17-2 TaxID=2976459 RepID=UPI0023D89F18|nr:hypothetical protein [Devosia sp. SD17-2]WEJ31987.1 hypothetical protein NYQ88_13870 [Devosia sp. SD17-2]